MNHSRVFILCIALILSIVQNSHTLSMFNRPVVICGRGYHPISNYNPTCEICPTGYYCPNGKEALPCPPKTSSKGKSTICTPCRTKVTEDRTNCLLEGFSRQSTELDHFTTSLFVEGSGSDNFMFRSQRYMGNLFGNQSLIVTENSQKTPITVYVSTKTATPNLYNYEYVFSGVYPTISFKPPSEFYVVYLNIVVEKYEKRPNISIKTGWS